MVELKKTLNGLANNRKILIAECKMQTESMDQKVGPIDQILKHITDLILIVNKLCLYMKGLAAATLTSRAVSSKSKPQSLNSIIKPLLSLLKLEEVEPEWADLFAQGLFNLCLCYENETAHPNHKIVANLKLHCEEIAAKCSSHEGEVNGKDQPAKQPKITCQLQPIHALRYFSLIFSRFHEMAFEKYPVLKEVFNNPKLIRLFIPLFCANCPIDVIEACLTKLNDMSADACRDSDLAADFKASLIMIFLDANSKASTSKDHRGIVNQILAYLHQEISKPSAIGLQTLLDLLNDFDTCMLPYSKIFIRRSLKLINENIDYDLKRLVFDVFSKILTLSYVQDSDGLPPFLNPELSGKWQRGNEFLLEFRSNKLYNVDIPDIKSVKLRPYQLEGIAWINFLFKYNLSGALCDDMGLGKTIQSLITILIFSQKNKSAKSLIVCPNSLVKHWEMEANKHYQGYSMKVVIIDKTFQGNWKQFKDVNLFITSDIMMVRSSSLFEKTPFLIGVLDEAHLIKNEKSKLSKAMKSLTIQHRLALTGTPIQVLPVNYRTT